MQMPRMFIPGAFLFAARDGNREHRSPQMAAGAVLFLTRGNKRSRSVFASLQNNSGGENDDRIYAYRRGRSARLRRLAVASSRPRPDGQACCRCRIRASRRVTVITMTSDPTDPPAEEPPPAPGPDIKEPPLPEPPPEPDIPPAPKPPVEEPSR